MATRKHRQTFYADSVVENHLEAIPRQQRSYWINKTLTKVIEGESGQQGELVQLRDWLKSREGVSQVYDVIRETLDNFLSNDVGLPGTT